MGCLRLTYQKTTSKTEGTPIFEMGGKQVSDYYLFGMFRDACFSSSEKLSRTNPDKARGTADGLSGQMPGRHGSDNSEGEYRYGFQGQEVDGEVKGEGNSVNYKYRLHCSSRLYGNPRVGRFFAVDPLAGKYPHNGSYNFSENRVVDGVELEGLEYVHYYVFLDTDAKTRIKTVKVDDFRGMTNEQLEATHGIGAEEFYKKNSESYGERGKGVLYSYFIKDSRTGGFQSSGSIFESSEGYFEHGIYYGSGGPSEQGDRSSVPPGSDENLFVYTETPIDEVDALARLHDMAYDEAGVTDFHSDPKGIATDIFFIKALENYLDRASQEGYKDKYTNRAPSEEAIVKANRAITGFKALLINKTLNIPIKE